MTTLLGILLLLTLIWVFIAQLMRWRMARTVLLGVAVLLVILLVGIWIPRLFQKIGEQHQRATLTGEWHAVENPTNGPTYKITTTICPEGRIEWRGSVRDNANIITVNASGNWELEEDSFIYEISKSNAKPYFPAGYTATVTVEKITSDKLVYTDAQGERRVENKVEP